MKNLMRNLKKAFDNFVVNHTTIVVFIIGFVFGLLELIVQGFLIIGLKEVLGGNYTIIPVILIWGLFGLISVIAALIITVGANKAIEELNWYIYNIQYGHFWELYKTLKNLEKEEK